MEIVNYYPGWHPKKGSRPIRLKFLARNLLHPESAATLAASYASGTWGAINGRFKLNCLSTRIPGTYVWCFSCAGHGGYVLIGDRTMFPGVLTRDAAFNLSEQGRLLRLTCGDLFLSGFEEDCDWALLKSCFPELCYENVTNARESLQTLHNQLDNVCHCVGTWQSPETIREINAWLKSRGHQFQITEKKVSVFMTPSGEMKAYDMDLPRQLRDKIQYLEVHRPKTFDSRVPLETETLVGLWNPDDKTRAPLIFPDGIAEAKIVDTMRQTPGLRRCAARINDMANLEPFVDADDTRLR